MTLQLTRPLSYDQRKMHYAFLGPERSYIQCVKTCNVFEDCPVWRGIDPTCKPYDCEAWPLGLHDADTWPGEDAPTPRPPRAGVLGTTDTEIRQTGSLLDLIGRVCMALGLLLLALLVAGTAVALLGRILGWL